MLKRSNLLIFCRYTNYFKQPNEVKEGEKSFVINIQEDQWEFLKHVKINGKLIVPTSVYLNLVWQVFKSFKPDSEISVVYEKVKIHKQLVEIPEDEKLILVVMVQKGT